jgi:hypothetical protein
MKPRLVLLIPAIAVAMLGCSDRAFVRSDPPVSTEGVTVALVGQKCDREGWNEGYDVLDLEIVVRVTNHSASAVDVLPAEIRLLARGNAPVPRASTPKGEDAPIQVPPNSTADVRVHFHRRGNARCDQQMQLSLGRALEEAGHDVAVPPLSFVATSQDV